MQNQNAMIFAPIIPPVSPDGAIAARVVVRR